MEAPVTQFTIPDIFAQLSRPRNLSQYFAEVKAESDAWAASFHPFDEEGHEGLVKCDLGLLGSLVYSVREKEIVRLGCDLMAIFYVFDEYTDVVDGDGADKFREIFMDAICNPHKERPRGEHVLGAMARDFCLRASNYVSPGANCLDHYICDIDNYTSSVVAEAKVRTQRRYSSFQDFLKIRRYTVGVIPTYVLCEFGLDLPEEMVSHPQMIEFREQTAIVTAIANDIYSYAMEKSRGGGLDFHNAIEIVMVEQNLDSVQDAINWLERFAVDLLTSSLKNLANMPSWGIEVDQKAKTYFDCLEQALRGINDWSFECRRFFGSKGLEIQKTRMMTTTLLPREAWKPLVKDTA